MPLSCAKRVIAGSGTFAIAGAASVADGSVPEAACIPERGGTRRGIGNVIQKEESKTVQNHNKSKNRKKLDFLGVHDSKTF